MDDTQKPAAVPDPEEKIRGDESDFWSEARARSRAAGERVGREWDRLSGNAKEYADDHSVGVALGSLGVGIALGVLIGVLIARD
jgi:ElaB/YqjD/DUF883 family membrane-anchored ribosome-binding protein